MTTTNAKRGQGAGGTPGPHTSLPWKCVQKPRDVGYLVVTDAGFEEAITGGIRLKRDAEFIVRSVNSHAELVEALEKVVALDDDGMVTTGRALHDAIATARAALAKART